MRGREVGLAAMACSVLGAGYANHAAAVRSGPPRSTTTTSAYPTGLGPGAPLGPGAAEIPHSIAPATGARA